MPCGDPIDPSTQVGPLVAERQRERVLGYIGIGTSEGARITVGGDARRSSRKAGTSRPRCSPMSTTACVSLAKIFGPVLVAIPYETERDAIRIANDNDYGLSGSVWTADVERGVAIARKVRTGTYNVNGFTIDFCAPFGGFKASGIGREFGPEGIASYTEPKSIAIFA